MNYPYPEMSYILPEKHHYSFECVVRITQKEWENALEADFYTGDIKIYAYPGFTMYQSADESLGYAEEVIDIYLRYKPCKHKKCRKHMTFGPYKKCGLAEANALKFLIEHNFVEIIEAAI